MGMPPIPWHILCKLPIKRGVSIMDKPTHVGNRARPGGEVSPAQGVLGKEKEENTSIFQGFQEAKLFRTQDRATLTFYAGNEVASVHYDRNRNEIFFKGHNVKNMTLTPEQWFYLEKFSDFLAQEEGTEDMRKAYEACLSNMPPK